MKRPLFLLIILLLLGVLYLNRSYARVYTIIGDHYTAPPKITQPKRIGEGNEKIIRMVSLGDSLTAGVGLPNESETFSYKLAQRIVTSTSSVLLWNFGVPGATAHSMLATQLPLAVASKPTIATIIIGANDMHNHISVDEFSKDLETTILSLQKAGATVYVATTPFIGDEYLFRPPLANYFKWRTLLFSEVIEVVALSTRAIVVPLFDLTSSPLWREEGFYLNDHFHPNSKGYSVWADLFYKELN